MTPFRLRPITMAVAALGMQAPWLAPAIAQSLDDVVVSAGRQEQRSFDAPAAIQAVNSDAIRESGPQVNLSESLNRVPGVVVLNRQNYSQDLQLSIRGFGARSTFGIRGVRLIVDGIPATMPDGQGQASTVSLPSAQRIEVLRGPLAQLYGNAAGGVVQIFTMDGPKEPFGAFSLNSGSDGLRRWGLQTGGQSGSVNYIADYSDFAINGYREHSEAARRQFNTKWRFDLGAATRLTVVANSFDQIRGQDPLGLTRDQFQSNPRQAVAAAFQQDAGKKVMQNQVGSVLEHAIDGNNKIIGRLYYGSRDLDSNLSVPPAAQTAATSAGGVVTLDRRFYGLGLQYNNRAQLWGGPLTSVVGIDHDYMKDRRRGYLNTGGARGALKRDEDNIVSNTDIYAQTSWLFSPKWSVTAGLRSSSVKFKVNDYFIIPGNPDDSGDAKYSAVNPVLGLTHFVNDKVNVYANLGRGFESPTFTELAYRPAGASGLNFDLQASRSKHFEVGVKARINANHRVDAAVYQINTDNELNVDTNLGGRSTFRNAGRTGRTGLELSYAARWSESVSSLLSLNILRAEFKDTSGTIVAGNKLPGVPDRSLYAELAWRPKMEGALRGLNAGVELVHSGKLYVNDANTDAADGYTVFNLRAGLAQTLGNWRISEFVRLNNVGDKNYAGSVIVNDGNSRFFESAPGRNWSVGVTANYAFR